MADLTEIELPDGSVRKLGNIPSVPGKLKTWATYGDAKNTPLIPRSEWKARCDALGTGPDWPYLSPCHDQDGVGECACSAAVGAAENQRMKQGLPYIKLSAADLYKRVNGGVDQGSILEDGMYQISTTGVARESIVPYLDWRRSYPGAAEDRKNFRVLEVFLCPTFDHCFSAVLMGFDLISGIWWYNNYNPTSDGWLPSGRGGRGGHAVRGYKPTYKGNRYGIFHYNSWGTNWGVDGGKCVFPEEVYESHDIGGWWAIRSVVDEGGVIPT